MSKSKIVKVFSCKGFKGLMRLDGNKAYLAYRTPKGCKVENFELHQDELNPIVEKARIYCEHNALTLWSY